MSAGGRLGVGNDPRYNKTRCFETFPFPDPDEPTKQPIRELGEQLDAHRKRQQGLHPELTMTGMYNVLEKLREIETAHRAGSVSTRSDTHTVTRKAPGADASGAGELMLTKKEQLIHEQGLVSVLKQIHDDLDAAVFAAYGWPGTLTDEEILERLVALNHERAAEEAAGKVRWLRPEFQNPQGATKTQQTLAEAEPEEDEEESDKGQGASAKGKKKPAKGTAKAAGTPAKAVWPSTLAARFQAIRQALTARGKPATPEEIATGFSRAKKDQVAEILETLVTVGQARQTKGGKFVG